MGVNDHDAPSKKPTAAERAERDAEIKAREQYKELQRALSESFAPLIEMHETTMPTLTLRGISIQSTDKGDYRVVLKVNQYAADGNAIPLVAFTNGQTFIGSLATALESLRYGILAFRPDRFAAPSRSVPAHLRGK